MSISSVVLLKTCGFCPVLPFVHGGVDALLLHELLVRPVLRHLALTHHEYLVTPDDGAGGLAYMTPMLGSRGVTIPLYFDPNPDPESAKG